MTVPLWVRDGEKKGIMEGYTGRFASMCVLLLLKEIGSKYDKMLELARAGW